MRIAFLIIKDYRQSHSITNGPIGLAYLSSAAKARFEDVEVCIEVDPDKILAYRPDIVGVTSFTETYSQSIEAARYLKRQRPELPIWLGGAHINALPQTLAEDFDIGVVGEGEESFVELLELWRAGRATPDELQHVKGICYWENGEVQVTAPRDPVQELDRIVAPDRSIMKAYWPPLQREIQWPQPIYTSRGCPFKCVFCIFSMDDSKVRYHSVERVVLEIEDILRHHPEQEQISINDDLFALSKKRLHALTQGIRAAGLHKKVGFVCMAKASVFSDEMAKLMRDMNVTMVTFGFESGVDRLLKYLKGPRNHVSENTRAIDISARHGIRHGGYFIVGAPDESYAELQQNYWYIRHNFPPMSIVGIYRLTPFPGTQFWHEAIQLGVVPEKVVDWKPFRYYDDLEREFLFSNQHYSRERFNEAYGEFMKLTGDNQLALTVEAQEKAFKCLLEPIYSAHLKRLHPQKVLELSGFIRMLAAWTAEELGLPSDVDLLHPWAWKTWASRSDTQRYDLILVNLALEQIPVKPAQVLARLEQALAPGGEMILICYNPRHSQILLSLLKGDWSMQFWGRPPFDLFHFFTPQQLQAQRSDSLKWDAPLPLEDPHAEPLPESVASALSQLGEDVLKESTQIAYVLRCVKAHRPVACASALQ